MGVNSSRKRRRRKSKVDRPAKPYDGFPLCPANNGYWQKKINGKIHYFTRWGKVVNGSLQRLQEDGCWQAALELYEQQRDALFAGRKPRVKSDKLTVGELRGRFLTMKSRALDAGKITARTYMEYRATADRLAGFFGEDRPVDDVAADDFEELWADITKRWGPVRQGNEIQRVRTLFKYAHESGLIAEPVRYGSVFKKPSARELRKHRAANGKRMFDAAEVRAMLDAASAPLKAMILLGVNCGFGNADCGSLPFAALDLDNGWIDFPRPKTGIERRCPLWPETVAALRAAIAGRPPHRNKADADVVFVTKYGGRWVRTQGPKHVPVDAVSGEFGKLLHARRCPKCRTLQTDAKAEGCACCKWKPGGGTDWVRLHRPGLGFYALRHTFRTVADATKDFPAIRLVMGHADASIDATYRETIDDARLLAVTEHVRSWLFGDKV